MTKLGHTSLFHSLTEMIMLGNILASSEPVYSLTRTHHGVNYFANAYKFEQHHPTNSHERIAVEHQVEKEFHTILVQN